MCIRDRYMGNEELSLCYYNLGVVFLRSGSHSAAMQNFHSCMTLKKRMKESDKNNALIIQCYIGIAECEWKEDRTKDGVISKLENIWLEYSPKFTERQKVLGDLKFSIAMFKIQDYSEDSALADLKECRKIYLKTLPDDHPSVEQVNRLMKKLNSMLGNEDNNDAETNEDY
eukprot:TRINITY_DN4632_c0_g1_i1.p1 TRINITY_DN4632_c0_g1~~TRINITY_DN4632_c0_g1_i1.p1  ORF type:complete len:171 (-),score=41.17 TRINITY_DN4632_c0_g1_i1:75-587(-)